MPTVPLKSKRFTKQIECGNGPIQTLRRSMPPPMQWFGRRKAVKCQKLIEIQTLNFNRILTTYTKSADTS